MLLEMNNLRITVRQEYLKSSNLTLPLEYLIPFHSQVFQMLETIFLGQIFQFHSQYPELKKRKH